MIPRKRSYLFKRAFSGFFDWFQPKKWASYDTVKEDGVFLLQLLRRTLSRDPETGRRKKRRQYKNFDEFLAREGVSGAKLAQMERQLGLYSILYGTLAVVVFAYAFVLFHKHMYIGGVVTILLSAMLGIQGLHQSLLRMRFKNRSFDIGVKEWLRSFFKRS